MIPLSFLRLSLAFACMAASLPASLAFGVSPSSSLLTLRRPASDFTATRLPWSSRRTGAPLSSLQMQETNFFSKFTRTLVEKAKADVDRVNRLFSGLENIRGDMGVIDELLSFWNMDETEDTLDRLEDALITRDFGVGTAVKICDELRDAMKSGEIQEAKELRGKMKAKIVDILKSGGDNTLMLDDEPPAVLMFVGVNGGGKTTTIGKLAAKLTGEGKKVMLAAGDTFRAAADMQLEEWATRSGAVMAPRTNAKSPAAVMFDAIDASQADEMDVLIADTSGRLHTNVNLMKELEKVRGVFEKKMPGKPKEVLLVVDSTQGQNVVNQAKGFNEAVGVTGIVLTKLDGTSKGGVVVSIVDELQIPVKFIGVGEKVEDLMLFDAEEYVEALFPN